MHGSAPPLAGKNVANPMGAILSAALMLETLGWTAEAAAIEQAVEAAVAAGQTTSDIGGTLGTTRGRRRHRRGRRARHSESRTGPMTNDLFILGGARTPMTQHVGALKDVSAIELGAIATRGALARTGVTPDAVDHVVFGNVQQSSTDAHYGARHVGLRAGLPIEVPALTVNRLCGSGIQAVVSGAQQILLGEAGDGGRRRHGEHEPGAARDSRPAQRPAPRPGQARRLAVGRPERPLRRLLDGDHGRELRGEVRHHARGRPTATRCAASSARTRPGRRA